MTFVWSVYIISSVLVVMQHAVRFLSLTSFPTSNITHVGVQLYHLPAYAYAGCETSSAMLARNICRLTRNGRMAEVRWQVVCELLPSSTRKDSVGTRELHAFLASLDLGG